MKRLIVLVATLSLLGLVSGCGNSGSAASPPADAQLAAGEGSVKVTWTMTPGVNYWIYYAPGSYDATVDVSKAPGHASLIDVTSPFIVPGLTNGQAYSFSVFANTNNGPLGAGSPTQVATPRIAGAVWKAGTPTGSDNLLGVAAVTAATTGTAMVAVGSNGVIFSSPDGIAWSAQASTVTSALNAAAYGGNYVVAGAGGIVLFSSDAVTWAAKASGTANDLNGLATNGAGIYVAAGAAGAITTSADGGQTWTLRSNASQDLSAAAYGNAAFVAVGAKGTVLRSVDAVNWQAVSLSGAAASADLKGVAYALVGGVTPTFVAVGVGGTIISSVDNGVTWTQQTSPVAEALEGVTSDPHIVSLASDGTVVTSAQFVAVGKNGTIVTSADASSWQAQTSGTSNDLNAVTHIPYGYSAVGSSGVNLTAY